MDATEPDTADGSRTGAGLRFPVSLRVSSIGRMLNAELADDSVYDGFELQAYDDPVHGTGMLAFLQRQADRRVDFYVQPGLRLDPDGFRIGGGIGSWTETRFEAARLDVADDGVDVEVGFTDRDGRPVEIRIDDRDGRRRRRARLLAPVGAGIEQPESLLLVWMHGFDLVHATVARPLIRIGGRDASTGTLPGTRLHRRHLIKVAGPLCAVEVNRSHAGPLPVGGGHRELIDTAGRLAGLVAEQGGHRARVGFDPPMPAPGSLIDGDEPQGRWHVVVDGARLTGGPWWMQSADGRVEVGMDVDERWRPGPLPPLMRLVTTVMPVFRRWPTTYRWRAVVEPGTPPRMTSGWERVGGDDGGAYRRATGS
jgi:hypothetical protein